ncbi:MAG: hypothetical protein Q9224_001675, partial [Gallowayella concinna]
MAFAMEHNLAAKDSHESFQSAHSQQMEQPAFPSASNQLDTNLHTAALQAAGLPVYDIEAFLNDPRNQEVLNSKSPPQKKQKTNQHSSSSSVPEQLGTPKTSHNVPAFHHLCQERALVAEFDIDGDGIQGFGGTVTVGGQTITSDQLWRTKKEAKECLAELGIPVVREMEAVHKDKREQMAPKEKGEPDKNWVGMLLEYHNAIDPTHVLPGPIYTEYALGPSFACTVTIPSQPSHPFGSQTTPFSTKKSARSNAAKDAVHHLISTGDLNPDGSCKSRKKAKGVGAGPVVKVDAHGLEVQKNATYANRVADLAPLLSFMVPVYRFEPVSAAAPNMFSGAAYFTGDAVEAHPKLKGPVAEVRNVFGKKNAKE